MSYSEILKAIRGIRTRIINKGDTKLLAESILTQIDMPTFVHIVLVEGIAEFLERLFHFLRFPVNAIMPLLTLYFEKC